MTDQFKISYDWLPRDYGDAIERATLADLNILVAGKSVTRLEDKAAKTIRDSSRLSAYDLARWLAANWWRLRWEPASLDQDWFMSHKISAAGGGYSWPDVTLLTDGSTMTVRVRPTDGRTDPVRYLANFEERIIAEEFEAGVDEFIEQVLNRLSELDVHQTELKELWQDVLAERADPEATEYRKLEALLSHDPDEADKDFILKLRESTSSVGLHAVEEIAAALKWDALLNITQLSEQRAHGPTPILIPDSKQLKLSIKSQVEGMRLPWEQANIAAKVVRNAWDLVPGPIPTDKFAELLSFDHNLILNTAGSKLPMEAAFRDEEDGDKVGVLLKHHSRPEQRRFAVARLVADHITADVSDQLLPATDARTARQKFQRAFASKFLLPVEELRGRLNNDYPTDEWIEETANDYGVTEMVVRNMLFDEGLIEEWHWG